MTPDRYVGLGTQIYKVVKPITNWPRELKPEGFSKCAVDSRGNLYVCQRADPPIIVFDSAGKFVRTIGAGRDTDSHGIWITADDRVLLVDRDAHQVLCYSAKGELLFTLGESNRPRFQAPFSHPTDVAVGLNGDIYVADGYGNMMVHRFSADGKLKKSWGGFGTGPGQFTTPHGINVLADGRLLVGDRENDRIQVFDPEGNYLTEWHGFYHPMDIHVDSQGLIYVTDQRPRLTAINDRGEIMGACKPNVDIPHGISGDTDGNLYMVATRKPASITKLVPVK